LAVFSIKSIINQLLIVKKIDIVEGFRFVL